MLAKGLLKVKRRMFLILTWFRYSGHQGFDDVYSPLFALVLIWNGLHEVKQLRENNETLKWEAHTSKYIYDC